MKGVDIDEEAHPQAGGREKGVGCWASIYGKPVLMATSTRGQTRQRGGMAHQCIV
jgi:hypothetical protein